MRWIFDVEGCYQHLLAVLQQQSHHVIQNNTLVMYDKDSTAYPFSRSSEIDGSDKTQRISPVRMVRQAQPHQAPLFYTQGVLYQDSASVRACAREVYIWNAVICMIVLMQSWKRTCCSHEQGIKKG